MQQPRSKANNQPRLQARNVKKSTARGEEDPGAPLTNDDGAGLGDLVAVYLDPETLPLRVTPVFGASSPLLVRHLDGQPLRRYRHSNRGAADGKRGAVSAEEGGARGGGERQALKGSR